MSSDRATTRAAVLLSWLALPAVAHAQTPATATPNAAPNAAPSAAPSAAAEQILVTAKKRRQNVQLVTQVVDVVRGTTLRRYQLNQFQDLQAVIGGLQMSDANGRGQNVTLRGVTHDPDTTANPAVDLYLNEVPITQIGSAFQDLYDTDQVEILRGPQGTLRGRTSPAGAILIETRKPDLSRVTGDASQSLSTNGLWRTELALSAPLITDKLAVRVAGLFNQNDLYETRNITTGKSDFNLQHSWRISALLKPSDAFDITLVNQASNTRSTQFQAVTGVGAHGSFTPQDNIALAPGPYSFYNRTNITTLNATWHLGDLDLAYIAGYQAAKDEAAQDVDLGAFLGGFDYGNMDLDIAVNQLTQEFRIQSTGRRRLDYMLGFYYAHQDANARVITPSEVLFHNTPGQGAFNLTPYDSIVATVGIPQLVTDYAVFTDETFRLSDRDIIEGGLRWQFERQYRSSSLAAAIASSGQVVYDLPLISKSREHEEFRAWTGLASYTHRFTPNAQIYASYGQSFRPGGVVLGITLPLPEDFLIFQPETSYDFEIGGKTSWFDGRLRVNADIYHQAYSNYIARYNYLYTRYGQQNFTINGNAIARGAELSVTAFPTESLQAELNLNYADAHFDNARIPCNDFAGTGQPNTNGPPNVPGGALIAYCTTDASLGAPPFSASLGATYSFHLTDRVDAYLRGLYSFQAAATRALAPGNLDPRNLVNLYAGLRSPSGRWDAMLFAKNLLGMTGSANLVGELRITGYDDVPQFHDLPSGYSGVRTERPREIGAAVSYHF